MKTEQELFDDMEKDGASIFFPQKKFQQAKDFIYLTPDGDFIHTNLKTKQAPYTMEVDYDRDNSYEIDMFMDELDRMIDLLGERYKDEDMETYWHSSQFTLYLPFDRSESHVVFGLDGDLFYCDSETGDNCHLIVDRA